MPTQPEFYAPWPLKNRNFSTQLNEIRKSTETMAVLARASGFDLDPNQLRDSSLQAWNVGDLDFHNRFRLFYDDSDGSFKIQRNTGTSANPTWVTDFSIDSSGNVSS